MKMDLETCPDCGTPPVANAPAGLCPRCLLQLGRCLDDGTANEVGAEEGGWEPEIREAAPFSAPSVLRSLGGVPLIHLRDVADDSRVIRPNSPEMPDLSGQASRYQIVGEVARGGMGVIFHGRDLDLGRDLAFKVILEKHREQTEMIRRFIEEAQIGGQLQHPGVVPVHELGRFLDGRLYIAMKLVRGRTLAAQLEARKSPDEDRPRFLSVFEQVCQAMAYAHSRGVIHRDLKPSNVMVGNFGEVQVMDWGLAKVLDQGGVADEEGSLRSTAEGPVVRRLRSGSAAPESRVGSVLGTPSYMAPEQARGALDTLDERADVFALGSILCEILTGKPAFTGRSEAELCRKAELAELSDAYARLAACGADAELVTLACSCLAAAPKHRPRDAGVAVAGLTAYLAGVERRLQEAGLARAGAEASAAGERKRRVLAVALATSVLATVLLVATGWVWIERERQRHGKALFLAADAALDDAAKKRERARAAEGDPVPWVEAIEAARRAESLIAGEAGAGARQRVRAYLADLVHERDAAEAAEKDRRMVERLAAIHNDVGVHNDPSRADAEYAAAFRAYGVDLDVLEPVAAGRAALREPGGCGPGERIGSVGVHSSCGFPQEFHGRGSPCGRCQGSRPRPLAEPSARHAGRDEGRPGPQARSAGAASGDR